jgi:hypothetical protein
MSAVDAFAERWGLPRMARCDTCGDAANSAPGLPCGRDLSEEMGRPAGSAICGGTYYVSTPNRELLAEVYRRLAVGLPSELTPSELALLTAAVRDEAPAACGDRIPDHHETLWHRGPVFYCSAECMGQACERAEYQALTAYERGAYDAIGQRGGDHRECMAAVASL